MATFLFNPFLPFFNLIYFLLAVEDSRETTKSKRTLFTSIFSPLNQFDIETANIYFKT